MSDENPTHLALSENDTVTMTLQVPAGRQDAFFRLWLDFTASGDSPQDEAVRARARDEEQGVESLKHLYRIAQGDSGQCRRVASFLAGLYNGTRFPFDLTNFRGLDGELFEHCMAVLRLDSRPQQEVHMYFEDGGRKWEEMILNWGFGKVRRHE